MRSILNNAVGGDRITITKRIERPRLAACSGTCQSNLASVQCATRKTGNAIKIIGNIYLAIGRAYAVLTIGSITISVIAVAIAISIGGVAGLVPTLIDDASKAQNLITGKQPLLFDDCKNRINDSRLRLRVFLCFVFVWLIPIERPMYRW